MTQITLSIIIPTWNTADITKKCIDTIIAHLPIGFAEIIIVDNGSTDDTQNKFEKLNTIVYIRNNTNLGFSKANNIGARAANGKYLLFLNSDMELTDSHLVNMVEFLESHPDTGLIGPCFLNPDLTPQGSVFPPQTPLNAFKEYWLNNTGSYSKTIPVTASPISVWAISGGAVLIDKILFNQLNGWNESYFMFYEDLDLCRNIRNLHQKIVYFPNCKVIHRHGASGKTVTNTNNQWRRLIPSSKKYFGAFQHYLIFLIMWSSQKLRRRQ